MDRLLVVGATGSLGRAVAETALARGGGTHVRVLVRDPKRLAASLRGRVDVVVGDGRDPRAARDAMAGVDRVFSCAGASVMPALGRGWRGYGAVDWTINRTLVDAAAEARARRFVYVSVFHPPAMARLPYIAAHERVVEHLRGSGLGYGVVRPTGFFSTVGVFVDMARKGAIPEIGASRVRTNPIADEDLALVCADALASDDPQLELEAGGPDVVTRREIGELAFAAVGRRPKFRHIPGWLARAGAWMLRPLHPRMSQFASFVAALGAYDNIAPARGRRRLADAFTERARGV
jgi:uncharacterized protein YbjT (DUF2867 family)